MKKRHKMLFIKNSALLIVIDSYVTLNIADRSDDCTGINMLLLAFLHYLSRLSCHHSYHSIQHASS